MKRIRERINNTMPYSDTSHDNPLHPVNCLYLSLSRSLALPLSCSPPVRSHVTSLPFYAIEKIVLSLMTKPQSSLVISSLKYSLSASMLWREILEYRACV